MSTWADMLENDLSWREAELASLKRVAISSSDNDVLYKSILRANWALLYAHFEGYTKFCWELVLDAVEQSGTTVEQLSDDFLVLSLEKNFKNLRGNLDTKSMWAFYDTELSNLLSSVALFHGECRLDADSNLWPNVFEEENAKIGIVCPELDNSRARIKTLVARRNSIAHGEKMTIRSAKEYSEYENITLCVMHDLALQVLSLLENKTYIKA